MKALTLEETPVEPRTAVYVDPSAYYFDASLARTAWPLRWETIRGLLLRWSAAPILTTAASATLGMSASGVSASAGRFVLQVIGTATTDPISSIQKVLDESASSPQEPRALTAFRELAEWLELPDEEVARLVGIGRTTPYAWARRGSEPRPATTRRLYQLHVTLGAVKGRLGGRRFAAWLRASVRELILSGSLEEAIEQARRVLFPDSYERRVGLGAWTPEQAVGRPPRLATARAAPSPPRKARRVRGTR